MIKESPTMKARSQELRRNMTPEEGILWHCYLKKYKYQWYRQRVIGNYIADFYCKALKLVIEIDGSQHFEETDLAYDAIRTEYFESLGIEVIRFTNIDINKRLRYVCDYIDLKVEERRMLQ